VALAAQFDSIEFLHEIARWSRWVALIVAVAGSALSRDYRFGLACAIAATVDIWMLIAIADRGRDALASHDLVSIGHGALAALVGGRLAVKTALLVIAALLPRVFPFWGTVAGVLVVDSTVVLAGGPLAALRSFRHGGT
jgi:hypothetical protein